ncbi:hypothetical protein GOBAR_DD28664 [Gossypium barbadense]|nr:hypothetical protein GOBAR_DD28664 [Gossypium barbadense]
MALRSSDLVEKQRGSSGGSVLAESKSENYGSRDNGNVNRISYVGGGSVVVLDESVCQNVCGFGELRQRNVNGVVASGGDDMETVAARADESVVEVSSSKEPFPPVAPQSMANGNVVNTLETSESLDWKRSVNHISALAVIKMVLVDVVETEKRDCYGAQIVIFWRNKYLYTVDKSPLKYFLDEMHYGNSLRNTTTLGSEKERERVYDTIFRLPWRCEVLISVGFFICFDSFLSLLTIMPTRVLITFWRLLTTRLAIILRCSSNGLLQQNCVILAAFLFWPVESLSWVEQFWLPRYQPDISHDSRSRNNQTLCGLQCVGAQAITLSTCIVAHNNALFALLVSNNFAEIKSNVFKRFSRDNIHSLAYSDSVERFHISACLLFVLAQNILEAEGPWFESFLFNAFVVFVCEMLIDIIKHSFLAKFNDIKPIAYSEFLEDLCKQTLNIQTEDCKKNLTFVPLAPACVVIRVLTPVYAAHLPCSPLAWRFFWILVLISMTYIMLTSLKVMIGMGLQKHATWYVSRCRKRKHHLD